MTGELVQRSLRMRRRQFQACYEEALRREPGLAGGVTLRLTIGPSGEVAAMGWEEDTLGSAAVVSCMERRLSDLGFPSFTGCERVVARYPLVFRERRE